MNVDIGAIISRSFELVIRNRVFWVLGLSMGLTATTINFSVTLSGAEWISNSLFIVFFIIHAAFVAGTISAVARSERGSVPSFGEAWQAGKSKMWRVLGIYMIALVPVVLGLIIAILSLLLLNIIFSVHLPTFTGGSQPPGPTNPSAASVIATSIGRYFGSPWGPTLLAASLIAVLSTVVGLAERAVVLDNQRVGQAWSTGWRLLRQNIGNVILLWLVEFGVGIVQFIPSVIINQIIGMTIPLPITISGGIGGVLPGVLPGVIRWLASGLIFALPLVWLTAIWTMFYKAVTGRVALGTGRLAIYPGWPGRYLVPGQYSGGYAPPPSPPSDEQAK